MELQDLLESIKSAYNLAVKRNDTVGYTFKEKATLFNFQLKSLIKDMGQLEKIADDMFEKTVKPYLKSPLPNTINYKNYELINKQIGINSIQELLIELNSGEEFGELGGFDCLSKPDQKLDRFKIVILLNAISNSIFGCNYDYLIANIPEIPDRMVTSILRVMVHELTHLLNCFKITPEKLFADYLKQYFIDEDEERAHKIAFLYGICKEGALGRAQNLNYKDFRKWIDSSDSYLEIGPFIPPDNEKLKNEYEQFFTTIYDYLRSNESILENLHEGTDQELFFGRTTKNEILSRPFSKEELQHAADLMADYDSIAEALKYPDYPPNKQFLSNEKLINEYKEKMNKLGKFGY